MSVPNTTPQVIKDLITAAQLAGEPTGPLRWRLNQAERLEAGEYKHAGSFLHVAHIDRLEGSVSTDPVHLIADFAGAMLEKMRKNTLKREAAGLSDAWHANDWQEDCVRQLQAHVAKGDPLDVAILSAFCWYHGWPVSGADTPRFDWFNLMPSPVNWHELKTDEEMMTPLRLRAKTSELRFDDRGFAVGDGLMLRGWNGTEYTGAVLRFPIVSLLRGTKYGLMPGFVMLGLGDEVMSRAERTLHDAVDAIVLRKVDELAGDSARRIVDREQGVDFRAPGQVLCPGCDMEVCSCAEQRAEPRVIREEGKPDVVIGAETDEQRHQRLACPGCASLTCVCAHLSDLEQ
jgi:hypothetical protein